MSSSHTFGDPGESVYTLIVDDTELQLNCYLKGSIAGGSGTECFHTIDSTKLPEYLVEMGVNSGAQLSERFAACGSQELAEVHSKFMKFQTSTFVWVETDWSD